MFQAAHAMQMAKRYREQQIRYVDLTSFARTSRTWELSCFGIQPTILNPVVKLALAGIVRLALTAPWIANLSWCNERIDCDNKDASSPSTKAPRLILGYWQGERHFEDVVDRVRSAFAFPKIPSDICEVPSEHIGPTVAIHVRRGDFATDAKSKMLHLVCDERYYREAWRRMRTMLKNSSAWVFSDDPAWARDDLSLEGDVTFVETITSPAWIDMARMSKCDHFIISNSSYSWWAAYLGTNKAKRVIAPRYWYRGVETRTLRICPSEWLIAE